MKSLKILLSSVAIAALVTTVACKKDEKKEGEGDTAGAKTVDKDGDKDTKTADKPDTKTAPAGDMTNEQKAAEAVKMMEGMGKIFTDNKGNCDGMAGALSKFLDDNKALMAKGKEWDKDPEFKKLMDEKYKPQLEAAMGPMMGAMTECKDNEKLKAAMEKLAE